MFAQRLLTLMDNLADIWIPHNFRVSVFPSVLSLLSVHPLLVVVRPTRPRHGPQPGLPARLARLSAPSFPLKIRSDLCHRCDFDSELTGLWLTVRTSNTLFSRGAGGLLKLPPTPTAPHRLLYRNYYPPKSLAQNPLERSASSSSLSFSAFSSSWLALSRSPSARCLSSSALSRSRSIWSRSVDSATSVICKRPSKRPNSRSRSRTIERRSAPLCEASMAFSGALVGRFSRSA